MKNNKFITPVSMKVTVEQFERDLREPLTKLGYLWESCDSARDGYICTGWNDFNRGLGIAWKNYHPKVCENYLIDHYNPELFLALAAMTEGDIPIVGEWMKCVNNYTYNHFTYQKLYQVKCDFNSSGAFIDDEGEVNGFDYENKYNFIKLTKSEIIYSFTKQKKETNKEMKKFPLKCSAKDMQRIIDSVCDQWKHELTVLYSRNIVLGRESIVNKELYERVRKEASPEVNNLLDEIFGADEPKYQEGKAYLCTLKNSSDIFIRLYINGEFTTKLNEKGTAYLPSDYSKIEPLTAEYLPKI